MPLERVQNVSRLLARANTTPRKLTASMVARNKKPPTSEVRTASAVKKVHHSAKSAQAWRYPGGVIQRAPQLKLGSREYTDHKNPGEPRRKQESNFFITLNTNMSPNTPAEMSMCINGLRDAVKHLSKDHVLAACLKFGPVDSHYQLDRYGDVIVSAEWKSSVETGEIMNRVHAHIWLTIVHYSQIQINTQMLMAQTKVAYNKTKEDWGEFEKLRMKKNPYVHVKLLPQSDWAQIMRNYVTKNFASETGYEAVDFSS